MMPSILYPEAAKGGEASESDCKTPVKKVSVQAQLPAKFFNERLATPRVRCEVFVDEARSLRYRRPSARPRSDHYTAETEVLASMPSSGKCQKPWPSRKVAEVEELVKYMSSVPCYLQRVEKGENVQEKALNFGVIDWRRLEIWTNRQKTDQKNVVSSTINMADSPSLFTIQSCSYSGRNSSNFAAQKKEASCLSGSNSPAERNQTYSLDGHDRSDELKSSCMSRPPNSRTSPVSRSVWNSHENFHESKHESVASLQIQACSSIEEEKSQSWDQRRFNHDGRFSDKRLGRSFLKRGCGLDQPQETGYERSKTSSTMHGDLNAIEACNSLSLDILQSSGHLSAMFHTDKSDKGATALPAKNGVTSAKFMTKNEEGDQISKPSGNYNTGKQSSNQKVEDISGERKEPLPKNPFASGLGWLNRSSSLKAMSSSHQLNDTNGSEISDDRGRCDSRGRRSPLRRMLDPLFKSKYDGNSGPIVSSPIRRSQEHHNNNNAMHRSSDASIGSSSSQKPITPHGLLQDERYGVQMRQALVKLAWKNGRPLFMFSTNESSVLVASMRTTNRLGDEDSVGVYSIVAAQESKKKGGIWIGQSRNRKPNLLYDVVGRMEVSCSKLSAYDSKNLGVSKQFVLVRDEVLPTEECVDSVHSSQLAAIIVKAPYQKLNGYIYKAQDSLPVEKYPEYSRESRITAILPSGIHGFSDFGKPSILIERWKSGGSCDCGGWDEGCRLTVLADRLHEMKTASSVQECPTTTDVSGRIELSVQGGKAGKKHSFSMTAYKEGLHTVEFGSSISPLQAFAICIATLHSIDALDYSVRHRSMEDSPYENYPKLVSAQNNGGPTSYEPHHPPFSPVGRS